MITLDEILKQTCSIFSVSIEDMKSKTSKDEVVLARVAFCNFATEIGFTATIIAEILNRSISFVSYCIYSKKKELIIYKRGIKDLNAIIEKT